MRSSNYKSRDITVLFTQCRS